jgi:hypothetical protein
MRVVLHRPNMTAFGEMVPLKRAAAALCEAFSMQRHALI